MSLTSACSVWSVRVPMYLALGEHDYLLPPSKLWQSLRSVAATLTIDIYDRSGHWPHFEQRDAFDAALVDWLDAHPGR